MTTPETVAGKMSRERENLRALWGDEYPEKIGEVVQVIDRIAKRTDADPFQFAVKESIRADKAGRGMAAIQMAVAAAEIVERA